MRAHLVRIGNSRGIRIPKTMIQHAALSEDVEINLYKGGVLIKPVNEPRAGWDEAFRRMAKNGDDVLFDSDALVPDEWDKKEWEWK